MLLCENVYDKKKKKVNFINTVWTILLRFGVVKLARTWRFRQVVVDFSFRSIVLTSAFDLNKYTILDETVRDNDARNARRSSRKTKNRHRRRSTILLCLSRDDFAVNAKRRINVSSYRFWFLWNRPRVLLHTVDPTAVQSCTTTGLRSTDFLHDTPISETESCPARKPNSGRTQRRRNKTPTQ